MRNSIYINDLGDQYAPRGFGWRAALALGIMKYRQLFQVPTALALAAVLAAASTVETVSPAGWDCKRKEAFLEKAKVIRREPIPDGITNPEKLTLRDGSAVHAAHWQDVDVYIPVNRTPQGTELHFRDCYKYNIAAYRLDRMLGLNMTPVSVERRVAGSTGAITWWIDDILMKDRERYKKKIEPPNPEEWNRQMHRIRVFNELIYNTDGHIGNVLITGDWNLWIIDFTRAFRLNRQIRDRKNLESIDPAMLEALTALDEGSLMAELRPYLNKAEVKALIARRDRIVEHFEKRIARLGESAVLGEVPER